MNSDHEFTCEALFLSLLAHPVGKISLRGQDGILPPDPPAPAGFLFFFQSTVAPPAANINCSIQFQCKSESIKPGLMSPIFTYPFVCPPSQPRKYQRQEIAF